jgi:hypothetical protein
MHNVTFSGVRVTIVAMEKQQILHILSVCLYLWLTSMQSSRATLYCHLWPVRIYYIFTHYLLNGTIFGKK